MGGVSGPRCRAADPRWRRTFPQQSARRFTLRRDGGWNGDWNGASHLRVGARNGWPGPSRARTERCGRRARVGNPRHAQGAGVARAPGDCESPCREVPAESARQLHPVCGVGQHAAACGHHKGQRAAAKSIGRDAPVALTRTAAVWRAHCADCRRGHADLCGSRASEAKNRRGRWRCRAQTRR